MKYLYLNHININRNVRIMSVPIIDHIIIVFFITLFIAHKAHSHIGEPCNALLKVCLPPSQHMFCDEKSICRCRPEYPVQVGPHSCRKMRKVNERCSHIQECSQYDPNSYCTQIRSQSYCECHEGFVFDSNSQLCVVRENKHSKRSNLLFIPTAAAAIIACLSLLCCCVLICHNLFRKNQLSNRNHQRRVITDRCRARTLPDELNMEPHLNITANILTTGHGASRSLQAHSNDANMQSHLPAYDSTLCMHDEPPPSYEEVIKDSLAATSLSCKDSSTTSTPQMQQNVDNADIKL